MSQPESGYRQSVGEKKREGNRAPLHHPQITKRSNKRERQEVRSEGRSLSPEADRPVSIFQKELLRERI